MLPVWLISLDMGLTQSHLFGQILPTDIYVDFWQFFYQLCSTGIEFA